VRGVTDTDQRKERRNMPRKNQEQTVQVAFRLPKSIVTRLEEHAARMARSNPGLTFSRVDAVRVLLTSALAEVEVADKSRRKP
jgi:hypothetical protein